MFTLSRISCFFASPEPEGFTIPEGDTKVYDRLRDLILYILVSLTKEFDYAGKDGDNNNRQNDQRKVLFDEWDITEKVTTQYKRDYPGNSSSHIKYDETQIGHASDTGHKRSKGADDRDKTSNNNCFSAVFFVETMGSFKILFIEKSWLLFGKRLRSHRMPYPVIHRISRNGRDTEKNC